MNWINFAWIAGGLFGSLIVGLIVGRVAAGIKYPNPDKPHVFTPKQSLILLGAVLAAMAIMAFAVFYQPQPKDPAADMMDPAMGDMMGAPEDGEMMEGEIVDGDEALGEGSGDVVEEDSAEEESDAAEGDAIEGATEEEASADTDVKAAVNPGT